MVSSPDSVGGDGGMEGRGIRNWEEGLYLFRSEDREAAFGRALEIGEGGQSGGDEEGRRHDG